MPANFTVEDLAIDAKKINEVISGLPWRQQRKGDQVMLGSPAPQQEKKARPTPLSKFFQHNPGSSFFEQHFRDVSFDYKAIGAMSDPVDHWVKQMNEAEAQRLLKLYRLSLLDDCFSESKNLQTAEINLRRQLMIKTLERSAGATIERAIYTTAALFTCTIGIFTIFPLVRVVTAIAIGVTLGLVIGALIALVKAVQVWLAKKALEKLDSKYNNNQEYNSEKTQMNNLVDAAIMQKSAEEQPGALGITLPAPSL